MHRNTFTKLNIFNTLATVTKCRCLLPTADRSIYSTSLDTVLLINIILCVAFDKFIIT